MTYVKMHFSELLIIANSKTEMTNVNFEKIHSMGILLHDFKMMAKDNMEKYFCYNNTGKKEKHKNLYF